MSLMAGLFSMLAGCNDGTITVGRYDEATGKTSKIVYSKHYDNGLWLLQDKLGLVVSVDHEKKNIPAAHDVAQPAGALGPDDSLASGKVALSLWNFDSVPHQVKFKRMLVRSGELDFQNQVITAPAHEQSEIGAGSVPIFKYDKSIQTTLEVEVQGKPLRTVLDLPRRTQEQLKQYFSEGATPPYPWGARKVTP